jgi:hypothetical protein
VAHHNPSWRTFCVVSFPLTWPPANPLWHYHRMSCISWSKKNLLRIMSRPNLYNFPMINWYFDAWTTIWHFWVAEYVSGQAPLLRKTSMSSSFSGIASTQNKSSSRRWSLLSLPLSPEFNMDKWLGPTLHLPSFMITSNENSWNINNHRQILPSKIGLLTRYFGAWWLVNFFKWEPNK